MTSLNTRNIDETQELMPVPSAKAHTALGYWGWMYRRQHHLAGVTLSHMAVGVWFFFVLGPLQ